MREVIVCIFMAATFHSAMAQDKNRVHQQETITNYQDTAHQWLGIFAGPHLNHLNYDDKTTAIEGNNTGFHGGIFYQKKITEKFSIQPSIVISLRGGKITGVDSTVNAKLLNVEVPINFLYLYKQLYIGAGPNFCYALDGKFVSNGATRNAYDPSESFERTLKRFELGANFLIGYTFKKKIFIVANFSPGFTNIYRGDNSAPANLHANTSILGLSLGYKFAVAQEE